MGIRPPGLCFGLTVEFFDALPLVLASYLTFGAVQRRLRLLLGRRRGADDPGLRHFPHRALADELAGPGPAGSGRLLIQPPHSEALGPFPPAWARSGWFREQPERLRAARDLLLAGAAEQAARLARPEEHADLVHLFTWSVIVRIWAHQLDAAEEMAHALAEVLEDPAPARRLFAWVEARRAESLPGEAGEEAAARAIRHLDLLGPSLHETPAWSVLPAHLVLLRRSWMRLEWVNFDARRRLKTAVARHPRSAFVHLVRGHFAVAQGEVAQAADHLARALYHGRGAPHFAEAILALRGIEALRPGLVEEARARIPEAAKIDTREAAPLESAASQRGPIP